MLENSFKVIFFKIAPSSHNIIIILDRQFYHRMSTRKWKII